MSSADRENVEEFLRNVFRLKTAYQQCRTGQHSRRTFPTRPQSLPTRALTSVIVCA